MLQGYHELWRGWSTLEGLEYPGKDGWSTEGVEEPGRVDLGDGGDGVPGTGVEKEQKRDLNNGGKRDA